MISVSETFFLVSRSENRVIDAIGIISAISNASKINNSVVLVIIAMKRTKTARKERAKKAVKLPLNVGKGTERRF